MCHAGWGAFGNQLKEKHLEQNGHPTYSAFVLSDKDKVIHLQDDWVCNDFVVF